MKTSKLVLWAKRSSEETTTEKVLLTLELFPDDNKIIRKIVPSNAATEELALQLITKWKKGAEVVLPESTLTDEMALSASLQFVPDLYEAEDKELVLRTQTEWIFIVLSTKLYHSYQHELSEMKEKIDTLEKYSKESWENMKGFWSKVQSQIKEHNLFREHAQSLKGEVNNLFEFLKNLRSAEDAAFESESAKNVASFLAQLTPIEQAIEAEGADFQKLFNKLKQLQNDFKKIKITRSSRTELWERLDKAFKVLKEKRSPDSASNNSADTRLSRRIEGLQGAIAKMSTSIGRDQRELDVQEDKLSSTSVGQLETQLREVKAKLIKERISSKTKKLDDMKKTMDELKTRLAKMTARREQEVAEKAKKEAAAKAKADEKTKADEKAAALAATTEAPTTETSEIKDTSLEASDVVSKPTVLGEEVQAKEEEEAIDQATTSKDEEE